MDTKLKKSKIVGYGFYCIAWILAIAVVTIVFGALSVFIAQEHMIQLNDMPLDPEEGTHYFAGRITIWITWNGLLLWRILEMQEETTCISVALGVSTQSLKQK